MLCFYNGVTLDPLGIPGLWVGYIML
ncbi:UNVERIFIED_CONTAM: hypothetical protein NCL1_13231 [Trichonephila clavipes]